MIIFDFDQTLVDTSPVEHLRRGRRWADVMRQAPSLEIYAGIPELLADISEAGQIVAIVTKSPSMVAKSFIARHRWPVEILIGYHDVRRVKPDPEGLLLAMKRAGALPEDTIHVGDQAQDTEAARGAGVMAIGSTWGITDSTALRLSRPDKLVDTVSELRAYVAERFR